MEFIKQRKRRSALSEVIYVALNVALAVAIWLLVLVANTPVPALALVLISKWRMLAVRPRFWMANIQSNLVDVIVSVGYVALLATSTGAIWLQLAFMALYIVWLVLIKPRSRRAYMVAQAAIALVVGTTVVSVTLYGAWASIVTVAMWLIGYAVTRHVLFAYKQQAHVSFISLIGGLVLAELGWLTYHWTIAYEITQSVTLEIPQVAIIAAMVGLVAERSYASYIANDGVIRRSDVLLPLLMASSVLIILLVLFNAPETSLQ